MHRSIHLAPKCHSAGTDEQEDTHNNRPAPTDEPARRRTQHTWHPRHSILTQLPDLKRMERAHRGRRKSYLVILAPGAYPLTAKGVTTKDRLAGSRNAFPRYGLRKRCALSRNLTLVVTQLRQCWRAAHDVLSSAGHVRFLNFLRAHIVPHLNRLFECR